MRQADATNRRCVFCLNVTASVKEWKNQLIIYFYAIEVKKNSRTRRSTRDIHVTHATIVVQSTKKKSQCPAKTCEDSAPSVLCFLFFFYPKIAVFSIYNTSLCMCFRTLCVSTLVYVRANITLR